MLRSLLTIFLLTIFFRLSAQYTVEGNVLDASGKQALAFVNIGIVGTQNATSSDMGSPYVMQNRKRGL